MPTLPMPRVAWIVVVGTAVGATAVGCGAPDGQPVMLAETAAQVQVWRQRAPQRYELEVTFDCFCDPDRARTVVDNGTVVEASPGDFEPVTVDGLFHQMQQLLEGGYASASADYDPAFGLPTRFAIDPDSRRIDDEWAFQVTCFAAGNGHCTGN